MKELIENFKLDDRPSPLSNNELTSNNYELIFIISPVRIGSYRKRKRKEKKKNIMGERGPDSKRPNENCGALIPL